MLYEIIIATDNSYASENIMRQNITKESMKKIDQIEEETKRRQYRERKINCFDKHWKIVLN